MQDKKTPERMCIVCKNMFPKKDLIRVVKNKEGEFFIDTTLKMNGRGAYLCKNEECATKCFKKRYLNRAFKCEIQEEVYTKLWEVYELNKS
ncbi:MAG TPA: YlxR family protein [Clostridia bacterium]|nr:YlxR family protein [Clostridia bacterium]